MRKILLIAAAALMTGAPLAATDSAHAESTNRPQVQAQLADDWKPYKNYRTYKACMKEGKELKTAKIIEDYKCD